MAGPPAGPPAGPWGQRPAAARIAEDDRRAAGGALQTTCDACGAVLAYAPGTTDLRCLYCGNVKHIQDAPVAIVEQSLEDALDAGGGHAPLEETVVAVACGSCGARFTFDPDRHAGSCPFCGHPVVADPGEHRQIRPIGVLPFAIDARTARERLRGWLGSLWFAPSKLRDYARQDGALNGVYLPFWTFDSRTETDYTGQRGDFYYVPVQVTRTVNGRTVTQTEMVQKVRWHPVAGRVRRHFDDVLVLSSETLPRPMTEALEPWDLAALRPYTPNYLAGFQAETYRIGLADGFALADQRMQARIAADIRLDIGGDLQRIAGMDVRHADRSFKHVLLPIWIGAFLYAGTTYRVCISGQNGAVSGERPYSAWKIAFAVLLALIVLAVVWWLGGR
ncbi:MAG: hypothetical protein KDG89_06105 [Geminicoccaceae bacterium]|nr:hypothetical protein [Geminicoccaceae bacterium]